MSIEEYLFNNILSQQNGLILNVKFSGFRKEYRVLDDGPSTGSSTVGFYAVLEKATYLIGILG